MRETTQDRETLRKVFGCVRWTYNKCVHHLRETKKPAPLKELRALFVKEGSGAVVNNPWLNEVGFDIRDDALKEFRTSLKGNFTKLKTNDIASFDMRYRSKKRQKSETFYLRKRWITQTKNTIVLKLPKIVQDRPLEWQDQVAKSHPHGLQAPAHLDR